MTIRCLPHLLGPAKGRPLGLPGTSLRSLIKDGAFAVGTAAMSDLARLRLWKDPPIRDGLSWYLAVADDLGPAKFRIVATVPTQLDLAGAGEKSLWVSGCTTSNLGPAGVR
jgi:hypothetical protein